MPLSNELQSDNLLDNESIGGIWQCSIEGAFFKVELSKLFKYLSFGVISWPFLSVKSGRKLIEVDWTFAFDILRFGSIIALLGFGFVAGLTN